MKWRKIILLQYSVWYNTALCATRWHLEPWITENTSSHMIRSLFQFQNCIRLKFQNGWNGWRVWEVTRGQNLCRKWKRWISTGEEEIRLTAVSPGKPELGSPFEPRSPSWRDFFWVIWVPFFAAVVEGIHVVLKIVEISSCACSHSKPAVPDPRMECSQQASIISKQHPRST